MQSFSEMQNEKNIYEFRALIKDSKYAKGIEVERKNKQMEKSLCGAS